jgi:hypothetical protein
MISFKKIFLFFFLISIKIVTYSQCAMCKAVVESSDGSAEGVAGGINDGILYLMFIPYALIGTVGYFIYRHYKKNNHQEQA